MTSIAVFGSSGTKPGTQEWSDGVTIGRAITARGWTVVTGGYGGTMEAVSEGAAQAGLPVVGVTAPSVFPGRTGANPHVTAEWPAPTLAARIARIVDASAAAVALPGNLGTLTELLVAWNTAFVAPFGCRKPKPVVAVGAEWSRIIGLLTDVLPTGSDRVTVVDDVSAAIGHLDATVARRSSPQAIP